MRSVAAVVSGLALSAAFEPLAFAWLLPFGVLGFALTTRGLTPRRSALVGLLFGAAFYFTHIAWMRSSIGAPAWLTLSTVETLFYGALAATLPLLRTLPAAPLWCAAGWAAMENLRSTWPLSGMPWGRLSFAVIDTPAAPALAYVGMTGLSFALALLAFVLAEAIVAADRARGGTGPRRVVLLPAVGAVLVGASILLPALAPVDLEYDGEATVAVVQGDVPGPGNNILYDPPGVTANHVRATIGLAEDVAAGREPRPDLVVWPENSTTSDPFEPGVVRDGIEEAVARIGVPVVVGAIVDDGPKHILNQGIIWDPVTGPGQRYGKHHPVPYGEFIPWRNLWNPQFGRLGLIRRDVRPGTGATPMEAAGLRFADAICFDVAYDDVLPRQVRNGAQFLAVQTSNASFIFTHQIEQQFAITRLRAIESGRWLAVASTNGLTGIIDPDGRVVADAPARTPRVLVERMGLSDELTPALRMGEWPTRVFTGSFLVALVFGAVAYRRGREFRGPLTTGGSAETPAPPPTTSEAPRG
ncbi:apolipoprotein N-acyltransferase [Nocardioides sp.]|uniref:apolipoprotein N-acyltransferase n=1 Tax=Nocardioides sp. TaxID=35761 RepID=UPI003514EBD2